MSDVSFELSGPRAAILSTKKRLKCVDRAKSIAHYVAIEQVRNGLDLPGNSNRMTANHFWRDGLSFTRASTRSQQRRAEESSEPRQLELIVSFRSRTARG